MLAFAALAFASFHSVHPVATAPAACSAPVSAAGRAYVCTVGRGPDVLLIPGLGGSPAVWTSTVDQLRGRNRLHLAQVGGFGGAPAGPNANGPVLAPVVDALASYLRANTRGPVAVVGHSTGGKLALMLAARHPELVNRVLVIDMLPFFGLAVNPRAKGSADMAPVAEGAKRGVLEADAERFGAQQAAATARFALRADSRATVLRDVLASDRRVYAQGMYDLLLTDLRPELPRIDAPVTVLYAAGDKVVGWGPLDADALYRSSYGGLKGVRLIPVPDAGHLLMDDQPERYARELAAFVER